MNALGWWSLLVTVLVLAGYFRFVVKGRVGKTGRRVLGGLLIASALATVIILGHAPAGYKAVACCGMAIVVFFLVGYELLHPEVPDPVLRDYKTAVAALEEVAHFAPGRAGVVAARALVDLGVWVDTVELHEQPLPLTWAITRLAEAPPFKLPVHDGPIGPYLAESVLDGTWTFVVPVRVDDPPDGMTRVEYEGGSDLFYGAPA